jgi:hypothetical protein
MRIYSRIIIYMKDKRHVHERPHDYANEKTQKCPGKMTDCDGKRV